MDRGYARYTLLKLCREERWLYIIRARRDVIVEYQEKGHWHRKSVGRLPHRQGVARRYQGVYYHGEIKGEGRYHRLPGEGI